MRFILFLLFCLKHEDYAGGRIAFHPRKNSSCLKSIVFYPFSHYCIFHASNPDGISCNGKAPLAVQTEFPATPNRRCLSYIMLMLGTQLRTV